MRNDAYWLSLQSKGRQGVLVARVEVVVHRCGVRAHDIAREATDQLVLVRGEIQHRQLVESRAFGFEDLQREIVIRA